MQHLKDLVEKAKSAIEQIENKSLATLDEIRVEYFGKKGHFTQLMQELRNVAAEERPAMGAKINEAKQAALDFLNAKKYMNDAMLRSIVYSLISALFGTFIGMLIGYYLIIKNSKFMKIIDLISNMPYIIPGTFFGLGYLLYFKAPPIMITGTSIIVVLNVLFKQLPFSSRVGNTAMKSIDTDVINSLRDLGANTFYEIKDGIIPNIKPSLRISLINSFTTTMTTVGSIIFLVYPGKKLLTLVMFDVINSGKYGQGSVISLMIMIICIIFNILTNWMFGNKSFKERSNYVLRN